MSRWRSLLAVFLATLVVAVGVVVVVATSRDTPAAGTGVVVFQTVPPGPTRSLTPTSSYVAGPRPTLTVDSGCRPGDGPEALTEVPEPVAARVNRAWQRIETWLAANAPVSAASLRPPAGEESLSKTQRAIGVRLPAELIASLRRHNGVDPADTRTFTFPIFMHPLTAERITDEATMMCEVLVESGVDGSVGAWWHGQWVPVAVDHSGDSLFLDRGRLGRHYNEDNAAFDGPPTLTELLEQTADTLETGEGPARPVVIDGVLEWH